MENIEKTKEIKEERHDKNYIVDEKNKILSIFDNKEDVEKVNQILGIDLGKIPMGMTQFQIQNFVLNKREFSTPLMQYQQSKTELFTRMQGFIDSYYQIREAHAKIKLAEAEIDDFNNSTLNQKMKEAKIELQEIEIEKNKLRINSIEKQSKEKLREALVFNLTYQKHKNLENMSQDYLDKLEEIGWRIKSAYYPELPQRYNFTPKGQMKYPHELGKSAEEGLKVLMQMQEQQERLLENKNTMNQLLVSSDNSQIFDEQSNTLMSTGLNLPNIPNKITIPLEK